LSKGKEDDWALLQDNASVHKTKEVMDYIEKEAPFYVRGYPALSPDMNIIEDIWSMMNDELNKYKITTMTTLKRYLKKIWKDISLEKVRNCVDSMPRRIEKCISIKGERTNY
jgi:transposase